MNIIERVKEDLNKHYIKTLDDKRYRVLYEVIQNLEHNFYDDCGNTFEYNIEVKNNNELYIENTCIGELEDILDCQRIDDGIVLYVSDYKYIILLSCQPLSGVTSETKIESITREKRIECLYRYDDGEDIWDKIFSREESDKFEN